MKSKFRNDSEADSERHGTEIEKGFEDDHMFKVRESIPINLVTANKLSSF